MLHGVGMKSGSSISGGGGGETPAPDFLCKVPKPVIIVAYPRSGP